MKRMTFPVIVLVLLALSNAYAGKVQVQNVEDNKGGKYVVAELKEGAKFWHDRDYTLDSAPKEFLELTQIQPSVNCPGGQDYRLSFEIDRDAFVYTAWDSRHTRPEKRGQEPEGWFTNNHKDMGKSLFVQTKPVEPIEYWIYRSKRAYPKGKVELLGIDEVIGDPIIMWTIFLEEGSFIQVQPGGKLTATWAEIKAD